MVISTVAATIPKIIAARSAVFSPRSFMPSLSPIVVRMAGAVAVALLAACSEPTTSIRRFAVLDDIGSGDWQTVSVGVEHTCGIKTTGAAFCWGNNQFGQLAVARIDTTCGSEKSLYRCSLSPQPVQPGAKFASISAGADTPARSPSSREAYCWGANDLGQVGDFAATSPTLVRVPGSLGWAQISAGFYAHLRRPHGWRALLLGLRTIAASSASADSTGNTAFARVPIGVPIASVSAGQQRTCARTTLGPVYCWGAIWTSRERASRSLVRSRRRCRSRARRRMASLSVGAFTTCGADASGFAYCWEGESARRDGQWNAGRQHHAAACRDGSRVRSGERRHRAELRRRHERRRILLGRRYLRPIRRLAVAAGRAMRQPALAVQHSSHCGVRRAAVHRDQHRLRQPLLRRDDQGNLYCWGLGLSGQRGDGTATRRRRRSQAPILAPNRSSISLATEQSRTNASGSSRFIDARSLFDRLPSSPVTSPGSRRVSRLTSLPAAFPPCISTRSSLQRVFLAFTTGLFLACAAQVSSASAASVPASTSTTTR